MNMRWILYFLLAVLPYILSASSGQITVLHTTDSHGRLSATAGVRAVYAQFDSPNTLIIDCGDTLQGSYAAMLDGGAAVIAAMNELNYDVWVPGNHDADYGSEVLQQRIGEFAGTVLAANWQLDDTRLPGWKMFELPAGKVAVIGIGRSDQLERNVYRHKFLTVAPEIPDLKLSAAAAKAAGAEVIIAVWHGGRYDRLGGAGVLLEAVPEVDFVLGGHTHQEIPGEAVRGSFYAQAGKHFSYLGVVQIDLSNHAAVQISGYLTPLPEVRPEPDQSEIIAELPADIAFDNKSPAVNPLSSRGAEAIKELWAVPVSLHAVNLESGVIPARITAAGLYNMYPFEDDCVWIEVAEDELHAILQEQLLVRKTKAGRLLHVSGLLVQYRRRGWQLTELQLPPVTNKTYRLGLSSFLAAGGNGDFPELRRIAEKNGINFSGYNVRQAVEQYLRKNRKIETSAPWAHPAAAKKPH